MFTVTGEGPVFHLYNEFVSLVLAVRTDPEGGYQEVCLTHFGYPIDEPLNTLDRLILENGSSNDSLRQIMPYAFPTEGRGDYRVPLFAEAYEDGGNCTELYYEDYRYAAGKPKLEGLPQTYTEQDDEAETLTIILRDPLTKLKVEASITLFAHRPAIASSMKIVNEGSEKLTLSRAGSLCLALPGHFDMVQLWGSWGKERYVQRVPSATLVRSISSSRGASGHEHNPFAILCDPNADEFSGRCFGVSFVYSGDFEIAVQENAYDQTRLVCGLNPRSLDWPLAPGECFQTPEAVAVYSEQGFNGVSHVYHDLYRTRLCRGYWRDRPRPVLINNWEGTTFYFDHEKIMDIARSAAALGIEMLVLDDGWFGQRNNDHSSLGDWFVNYDKLPRGIKGLAEDVNALGMKFGLWFEPEMISPISELYEAHPDWCLHADGRPRTTARHQLTLDMSRTDVQDFVIESVASMLRSAPIDYVKWDMNRNFSEIGSSVSNRHGLPHRYMLGVYRVMEALIQEFPTVLFEGCSSGGGRFDPGFLYYMPQFWTSDDTDAVERLKIQYGTSFAYPNCTISAHVSASPNHQVGRVTGIKMRGDVALGGNFGYELDLPNQTTDEEKEVIREQVKLVKKIRETTHSGVFTRLLSPFEGNITAWSYADENRVILCAYRVLSTVKRGPVYVRLHDIPQGTYQDQNGKTYTERDLMNAGIKLEFPRQDFASMVTIFEKVK